MRERCPQRIPGLHYADAYDFDTPSEGSDDEPRTDRPDRGRRNGAAATPRRSNRRPSVHSLGGETIVASDDQRDDSDLRTPPRSGPPRRDGRDTETMPSRSDDGVRTTPRSRLSPCRRSGRHVETEVEREFRAPPLRRATELRSRIRSMWNSRRSNRNATSGYRGGSSKEDRRGRRGSMSDDSRSDSE